MKTLPGLLLAAVAVIVLAVASVIVLAAPGVTVLAAPAAAAPVLANFSGHWTWAKGDESLDLTLTQDGAALTGYHSSVGQHGMKVDEVEAPDPPSITGKVKGNIATLKFRSGYPDSTGGGTATLIRHKDFIDWRLLTSEGENYLPEKARLKPAQAPAE